MNSMHNVVLRYFLTATKEELLDEFAKLPHAVRGNGFVYVPGEREWKERLLLIGHADTVRRTDLPMKMLACRDNTFKTLDQEPLGADDRAGLAMLWILNADECEHSMLVTDGEEVGGLGAGEAVESILGELLQHAFCVEVDRKGVEELVFYDGCANDAFRAWLKDEAFVGWTQDTGSYTDIATICPATLLCGVNLAAGYYQQHTMHERLVYADWLKTLKALGKVVTRLEYPEFGEPDPTEPSRWSPSMALVCGERSYQGNSSYGAYQRGYNGIAWDEWNWQNDDDDDTPAVVGRVKPDDPADPGDAMNWIPVLNDAGDIVDHVDPATLSDELLDMALEDGCIDAADLSHSDLGEDLWVDEDEVDVPVLMH